MMLLKKVLKILLENDGHTLVVPKGTKLYHGTVEQYEKEKIAPGIDDVFWTSLNKKISSSYIPVSAGTNHLNTKHIAGPSLDKTIQNIQKIIGIEYDYNDVEFDQTGRAKSFRYPSIFQDLWKSHNQLSRELIKKENDLKELEKSIKYNDEKSVFASKMELYAKLEKEVKELKQKYYDTSPEYKINEYINVKLKELGYIPKQESSHDKNHRWELKTSGNTLNPASFKEKGRLLTIIPKRDLKIYDMTDGETIESDLTDLQYQKYNLFKKIEESDYDGIKIADYAQHHTQGNVGHYSIGLFEIALKDVDIEEEPAEHPENI